MRTRQLPQVSLGKLALLFIVGVTVGLALSSGGTSSAAANAMRPGFDANTFPGNDDGSTGLVPIGFTLNFFGNNYSSLYVNNNGNVTFDQPLGTYTPFDLTTTQRVIIAPFFADVDTRVGNVVKYGTGTVDGRPAFGVNWPGVGCFSYNISVLNYFQVVLIDRSDVAPGDFDIEFNYNSIQWETGQASGGDAACRGGNSARVGFSNGSGQPGTFFELAGSAQPGAFLDSNPSAGLIYNSLNSSTLGRYVFSARGGVPRTLDLTPDSATNPQFTSHTVTATLTGTSISGVPVNFQVSGANNGATGVCTPNANCTTNASGQVSFTYAGAAAGDDTISASATVDGIPVGDTAAKAWEELAIDMTLTPPSATNLQGSSHTVTAAVTRAGSPVSGALVSFIVTGANTGASGVCTPNADCTTNASGQVSFTYTGLATGTDTITASATVDSQGLSDTVEKTWSPIINQGNIFPVAGGGPSLASPKGLAFDSFGNMYVADSNHYRVRKITPGSDGFVNGGSDEVATTVAGKSAPSTPPFCGDGGPAISACLNKPGGVAVDASGNLYIADTLNDRIRKVDASTGNISTVAGGGPGCTEPCPATQQALSAPGGVVIDASGNLYIADTLNNRIRKVDASSGNISTVAGGGPGCTEPCSATQQALSAPSDVVIGASNNLYIADTYNHRIRKVVDNIITTAAGTGTQGFFGDNGPATSARLSAPQSVALDASNDLYIADRGNHRIRKVSGVTISTVAGGGSCTPPNIGDGGPATSACLNEPGGVAWRASGGLYIADTLNNRVRRLDGSQIITTVAGTPLVDFCGDGDSASISCLDKPAGAAAAPNGDVYIADTQNNRVRRVEAATGDITTVAGGGPGCVEPCPSTSASLSGPEHVAIDPLTGNLYISEPSAHRVRRVLALGGSNPSVVEGGEELRTVAGNGIPGTCGAGAPSTADCLTEPRGLVLFGSNLYIGQSGGDGRVHRVALGSLTIYPAFIDDQKSWGLAVDRSDPGLGNLYIAQRDAHRLKLVTAGGNFQIDPTDASTVVAGTGVAGSTYPADLTLATAAQLNLPVSVQVTDDGHVKFSNRGTHTIHVIDHGGDGIVGGGDAGELLYRIVGGASPTPGFCGDPDPGPPVVAHNGRDACLNSPFDIAWDETKDILYLADEVNDRLRKIPSDCDMDGLTDADEAALGTEPCQTDTDLDGCADNEEQAMGFDPRFPSGRWDVFDVPVAAEADPVPNGIRNRVVDMGDVLAVLLYAFAEDNGDQNANGVDYDSDKGADTNGDTTADIPPDSVEDGLAYDRSEGLPDPDGAGPLPDPAGEPNGVIDIGDVLAALAQAFVVDCTAAP